MKFVGTGHNESETTFILLPSFYQITSDPLFAFVHRLARSKSKIQKHERMDDPKCKVHDLCGFCV